MTSAACLAILVYRVAALPGWRDQRWFWFVAATASAYTAFGVLLTLDAPTWLTLFGAHANRCFLALHAVGWSLHAEAHLGQRLPKWQRLLCLGVMAVALLWLVPELLLSEQVTEFYVPWLGLNYHQASLTWLGHSGMLLVLAALVLPFVRFLRAASKNADARQYAAALGVLMMVGAHDEAVAGGVLRHPYLLDLGFLLTGMLVWRLLLARFTSATHRLDLLSTKLEGLVTERTQELAAAHEALAQAERLAAIGKLSAGVAHEINNPTAAVVSNLTYLKQSLGAGEVPGDTNEALSDSLASMAKIARIVRQLLDTGRVAGSGSPSHSSFSLTKVAQRAAQTARAALGNGAEVAVDVGDLFALGDALMAEQIVVNLITNGAQAVPESRAPFVLVRAEALQNSVRITVADNGGGMSEEVRRRAFEPFFSTKAFGKGTGLGLSVSLGLVKALGGELRIVSSSPAGTTMELLLRRSHRASTVPPSERTAPSVRRRRLLVVDDDPIVRESMSRMLSQLFSVATASGVSEAQRLIGRSQFDAILCDVMMDEGGGEALFNWLVRERPLAAEHVIFVTGGVTDDATRRFIEAQPQPVLYKPVDITTVERAVLEVGA